MSDYFFSGFTAEQVVDVIFNYPGIEQTELYCFFKSEFRDKVRKAAEEAEDLGKIVRIKSGKTYKLYMPFDAPNEAQK